MKQFHEFFKNFPVSIPTQIRPKDLLIHAYKEKGTPIL
jgi:hypothetical protein